MLPKLILLVFFVLSVGVFTFIKFAAKGVKAGYDYVQEKDKQASGSTPLARLSPSDTSLAERPSAENTLADRHQRERMEQFEERLRQHGFGSIPFSAVHGSEKVCGAVAALFARLINGKAIESVKVCSSHDLAVAWVGFIAVDMATQVTGADFELSGMVMFSSLVSLDGVTKDTAGAIGEGVGDLMMTTVNLHNCIATAGTAQEMCVVVAKSFMDWSREGGDASIFALRRMLPKVVSLIDATKATATV